MLAETLADAVRMRAVSERALESARVDTTAQTKVVAHPTDSHMLMPRIERVTALAKSTISSCASHSSGLAGRPAYPDLSRIILGCGHKQAMRWMRKLRTSLGRLDRDIGRYTTGDDRLEAAFAQTREGVARILSL